jgi:phage replication-related protein YjqB (UPF0714/DUF867 family)
MIRKLLYVFYSFIRLIVCFCLIILIISVTFSNASDRIYDNPEKSKNPRSGSLKELSLKVSEISQKDISHAIKSTGYRMKTNVTDFGDYKIEANVTDSDIIVIAIHGGKIERGTTELAYALSSRNNYNYYSYLGVKSGGNLNLHVASDKFEEPTALEMVSKSNITLSIHGCAGSEEFTYIGGLDKELGNKIKESLTKYGFTVSDTPKNLAGISPDNIVNKNRNESGIQIELSQGLRTQFLSGGSDELESYVNAISEAINDVQ